MPSKMFSHTSHVLDCALDEVFLITGNGVLHDGVPLLGLPGSLFASRRDVLLAIPKEPLAALVKDFVLHRAYGGLAALEVKRNPFWRRMKRMPVVAHDRARVSRVQLCWLPWAEDDWVSSWTLQASLEHR